jgi:hypothetical protein
MIAMSNLARQENLTGSHALMGDRTAPPSLAEDLIEGAGPIAKFIYGDDSEKSKRKIFYLASEVDSANRPPIFRLGKAKLAARRSRLLQWIAEREGPAA